MPFQVTEIPAAVASAAAVEFHYMHRRPQVRHSFGLWDGLVLRGIATFGTPASREVQKGACPLAPGWVIEFNRLWVSDDLGHGTESWFVARCLKRLPAYVVVSYADTAAGHLGYVYRALNFRYAGWTDMERKSARWDYIPLKEGIHTRDAYRNGWSHRVQRKPKVKYWTVTGDRCAKRWMAANCAWPELNWHRLPPPTEHRQCRDIASP